MVIPAAQPYRIPYESLAPASDAVLDLALSPPKNTLYYLLPFVGAFFSNYQELEINPSAEAMMPQAATRIMLQKIEELKNCADIKFKVVPYVGLCHQFSYYGGPFSATEPALLIPYQHLFRPNGDSPFGQEKQNENLQAKRWVFSDDETRFLIARELGQINGHNMLLKIAIKVAVLFAVFAVYTMSFSLGATLFIGALGLYILSEQHYQAKADRIAVEILRKCRVANPQQIAINTLEKMRQQNIERAENGKIASLFIRDGNNLLDFVRPYLTTRIARLRNA